MSWASLTTFMKITEHKTWRIGGSVANLSKAHGPSNRAVKLATPPQQENYHGNKTSYIVSGRTRNALQAQRQIRNEWASV